MDVPKVARVFKGTFVHAKSVSEAGVELNPSGAIGVFDNGRIAFVGNLLDIESLRSKYRFTSAVEVDLGSRFLIPGFVDTHNHAPQYQYSGTGTDLPLLEWLEKYTFPVEAKYSDIDFARNVYDKSIRRVMRNGTTTCCYFATIHLDASKLLADLCARHGLRAYVGKVSMDRNSPAFYVEPSAAAAIEAAEAFVRYVRDELCSPLVTPVVTPRFVPTCSSELMRGLGEIAATYNVPIQSHVAENKAELAWVHSLHPDCSSYTQVYDAHGLLSERCVMAHGCHLEPAELDLLRERGAGIAHCPVSNFNLKSGIFDTQRALRSGVKLGLGTDVSGGHSPSVLEVVRQAVVASNVLHMHDAAYTPANYKLMFALATLGGAQVLGLERQVGSFEPGKAFDALIVDPLTPDSPFDVFDGNSLEDIFQKFVLLGDDRNVAHVFVNGAQVAGSCLGQPL
eukprot:TRINITY_DN3250_c0_g1_i1.p1 TRINITY_DN3250_c0_g1~~TRINITY_DN3250_c0_g1_i1.p1  ORF type:complete len:452 (+),score=132.60 TRINITY_DN3250_c0_g1_i1:59-1414(+)